MAKKAKKSVKRAAPKRRRTPKVVLAANRRLRALIRSGRLYEGAGPHGTIPSAYGREMPSIPGWRPPTPILRTIPTRSAMVVIGRPTGKTGFKLTKLCGCRIVKTKNGRAAVRCTKPDGKTVMRFLSTADFVRSRRAKNVCAFVPMLENVDRTKKRARKSVSFSTTKGQRITLKRKPSPKMLKKYVALYYRQQRDRLRHIKRVTRPECIPGFAGDCI